jgi:hypothetical protein
LLQQLPSDNGVMPSRRCTIIFDTSGLNLLADDTEWNLIRAAFAVGFQVRMTETNICEVAATPSEVRRIQLLRICRQLICAGDGLEPYHEILQRLCRGHAANPSTFDWRAVDVRCPELEEEITRPTFLGTQEFADELKPHNSSSNNEFEEMWRTARAHFGLELRELGQIPVDDFFKSLEDPFWRLAADVYKRATGVEILGPEAKAFVDACPPVRAEITEEFIRDEGRSSRPAKDG